MPRYFKKDDKGVWVSRNGYPLDTVMEEFENRLEDPLVMGCDKGKKAPEPMIRAWAEFMNEAIDLSSLSECDKQEYHAKVQRIVDRTLDEGISRY